MGVLADEYIRLRPDVSRMPREIKRAGADAGKQFGGAFSGAARKLLAGGALFAGIAGVTRFLADANEAARESIKVGRTTAQIIKSTGGAAKVTAAQVGDLASAISLKTGMDDEAIQSGSNLLLTFKNVRNEIGTGAKIFDRATLAAVDLSKAGFGSIDSASKMLGKALNDPLKGLTALSRAGVTFTQQQKDQIKVMVESGNVLGAQKLIMKEVESQVGGVAAAQADWADKAKVAFENVKETVGGFLRQGLEPVSKWFVETGLPAVQDFFKKISSDKDLKVALTSLKDSLTALTGKDFKASLDGLATSLPPIVTAISDAITKYKEFSDVVDKFENKSFAEGDKRGGPVGQIVKDFKAGGTIEQVLIQFRGFIVRHVKQGWAAVVAAFIEDSSEVVAVVGRFVGRVIDWFARLPGRIMALVRRLWADVKASFSKNHAAIVADVKRFFDRVKSLWSSATTWLRGKWSSFWNTIKAVAQAAFNVVRSRISATWTVVRSLWTRAQTAVRTTWSTFWTGVKTTASRAMDAVRTKISTVLDRIKTAFSTAKSNIKRIWDGVKGVVSTPINWVKDNVYNKPLVPVWNRVASLVSGPKLSTYAAGGVEPGYTPGRDTHPIMVSGGEAIMRPEWTRVVGKDWIDKANAAARRGVGAARNFVGDPRGMPGFQSGGVVGWLKGLAGSATGKISDLAGKLKGWALGGLHALAEKIFSPVKSAIGSAMPNNGVGTTVGNIGKKAIDLVLDKIKTDDAAAMPALGGPAGSAIASGGWASIYRALRAVGARSFTTYPGHDQGPSRSRDIWPPSQAIADTARRLSSIWYVIYNRRIASKRHGNVWRPYTRSNPHTDHVHVTLNPGVAAKMGGIANFDQGGVFKPGLNLAYNGTGRDEFLRPVPRGGAVAAAVAQRPITILIDMGEGLVQKVQGIIDDNDEFRATVGRTR